MISRKPIKANLISLIPDITVLISLTPEELVEVILKLTFENKQNNNAHLHITKLLT